MVNTQMYRDIELPNLVNLYIADLRQFQNLTESQEIWLGIAIDSAKMLKRLLDARRDEKDFEYIYISLFTKIRTTVDELQSFEQYFQNSNFSLQDGIKLLVSETIEFKSTTVPTKQSVIIKLLEILPERAYDQLFELADFFWLLPLSVLNYYCKELEDKDSLPPISDILDIYNPLESSKEIKAVSDNSLTARGMLINSNLQYVKWFAFKYRNSGIDYEDAIQDGNIGLIKAVDKFDVRRNIRLKTLAIWWIRQSILRSIADNSRIIRLPVHLSDAFQSLKRQYRKYRDIHIDEPSVQTLAELSGLDLERSIEIIQWAKSPLPLEEIELCEENLMRSVNSKHNCRALFCRNCYGEASAQWQQAESLIVDREIPICLDQSLMGAHNEKSDCANILHAVFTDNHSEDELDRIFLEQINHIIAAALNQLRPREQRIIDYRYGFKEGEANTLQEVADKLDVTRERIRQIETAALVRLMQMLERDPAIREYNSLK